jgi:hypothetical protein
MGDEHNDLTGVWILRSVYHERVDTGEKILTYGEKPRGVIILDKGGRMAAIITASDEKTGGPAPRQVMAYSGRYRIENGERFATDVDIAWLPSWVGTKQGRNIKLQDNKLDIISDPVPLEFLGGAMAIGTLSWAREER